MLRKECVIEILSPAGGAHWYGAIAGSSIEAAARGLDRHEALCKVVLADDVLVTVVPGGVGGTHWNYARNAELPQYRHRVGRIREWQLSRNA